VYSDCTGERGSGFSYQHSGGSRGRFALVAGVVERVDGSWSVTGGRCWGQSLSLSLGEPPRMCWVGSDVGGQPETLAVLYSH
jgi:hypothetical protein